MLYVLFPLLLSASFVQLRDIPPFFLVSGAAGLEDRNVMQSPVGGESCIGGVRGIVCMDVSFLSPESSFLGVEFDSTPSSNCTEIKITL